MRTTRWIGFAGRMGAGKDYAYQYLFDQGYPVVRVSFADGLRHEIEVILGLSEPITKPYTELERKLQQWWGTEYRREMDVNWWVKRAEEVAFKAEEYGVPVFTDVRFPNEADMIRANGGLIVRLSASAATRASRLGIKVSEMPEHRSEYELDNYPSDIWMPTDLSEKRYARDMRDLARRAGLI